MHLRKLRGNRRARRNGYDAMTIKTISADEYHGSAGLSASLTKTLLSRSPFHAWQDSPLNPTRTQQEASRLDVGTIAHALLLEGVDNVEVIDAADWRTKAAKEQRDEARQAGKVPVLRHQYGQIIDMAEVASNSLAECPDMNGLKWSDGKPEQSIFWQSEGVDLRARLDWLANDYSIILDYKTTELSSPAAWMRAIPSNGYDVQAAHYLDAVKAETGKQADFSARCR